jgi:polyisoprenoid-binding protein YceI
VPGAIDAPHSYRRREMARFRLVPDRSELWAEARSTLHPVRVHTTGLTGVLELEIRGDGLELVPPTHVELETERLRSGNALVDGELRRRLEARKFPRIRGELTRSVAGAGDRRSWVAGELTFHGVTRNLEVEVTVRQLDEHTLEIEGARSIDMRDFGLPPPSFLMFRVQPEVQVRARLVGEREG